jgi:hypothetical protein
MRESHCVLIQFSASVKYRQVCKYLKETGVFLSLLTQRIKDNGKMMQSGDIITDCEGAYREYQQLVNSPRTRATYVC